MNIGDMYRFGNTYWICNRIHVNPESNRPTYSGKITNNEDPEIFYFNIDGDTVKIGLSNSSIRSYDEIESEKLQRVGTISDEELLKFFKAESKALYYSNARKAFSSGQWPFKGLLLRFSDDHCFGVIYHSRSLGLVYGYDIIPSDGRCIVAKREEKDLSKWSPIGILKYEIYQILHHLKIFDSDGSIKDFDSIYEKL